jgi:hypothetical protein
MKRLICLIPALLLLSTPSFSDGTAGKPSSIQLTVYNQNFALVKENREMNLVNGINFISVPDVAATIEPSSIAFKSLTAPDSVVVREQNYRYDVIEPTTILNKSIGKKIKIRFLSGGQMQEVEGVLLNAATTPRQVGYGGEGPEYQESPQGLVVRTSTGIVMIPSASGSENTSIEVEELPEGLVGRPTLVWKLETDKPGVHQTEVSYIANAMTWKADYVATIDPLDKYIDIIGWVTLDNKSGATYENASLNLMAGDVHRVEQRPRAMMMGKVDMAAMGGIAEPQFTEKTLFEYHLYTLKGKTTVRDKETKQITLMSAAQIPATKTYIFDPRKTWWMGMGDYRPGESYDVNPDKKVAVMMEIANTRENNLGIPLPKGTVRVYKQEMSANQEFVGEDEIDHTPKDEKIRLYLGNAFDVVGEHERTNFRRISAREVEESFKITIRNHKDTAISVLGVDHLFGDWIITQSSSKPNKKDASTVEFPVSVPKNGEVVVTYTVRTKWM